MDYYQYLVQNEDSMTEILIAMFSQQPFDTFEETEGGFGAYIPAKEYADTVEAYVKELQRQFDFKYEVNHIPAQNWNAVWESNFQPILVDKFCGIRADFHPPLPHVQHELVINPKLAFGTGHHETTWMMMKMLENRTLRNKKVFDYGCGTGILAILAAKLGATELDAVDIEEPSYENTLENIEINQVRGITTYLGTLETIPFRVYDLILANINRHVILDSFTALYQRLHRNGRLVISGILKSDEALILDAAKSHNWQFVQRLERGEWICVEFKKTQV
ncbi:MAG: 50S ribosomal protein L11 methyltransferase [Saprospiraceae bacterium]